jgi:hypothetical protein
MPNRINDSAFKKKSTVFETNGVVFKTNNFYSLLTLSNLFKPTQSNPILFYYLNSNFKPLSNHYNQWLNDSDWNTKIPINAIKFVDLNYTNLNESNKYDFDMYDIFSSLQTHSLKHVNNLSKKEFVLYVTSDIIVGPKVLTCFTKDYSVPASSDQVNYNKRFYTSVNKLREEMASECYLSLHNTNQLSYYSFLYNMETIHKMSDFSGMLIVKLDDQTKTKKEFETISIKKRLDESLVSRENVYKCTYKSDLYKFDSLDGSRSINLFENTFCVFGFELNTYEPPYLQNIFFDSYSNVNYLDKMLRKMLYGQAETFGYGFKRGNEPNIPNVVHLLWFGDKFKTMKFIEYLSLKSILNVLKPDKVRIHGDNKPACDLWKELSANPKIEWVERKRPLFKYGQDFSQSPIQVNSFSRVKTKNEE